MIQIIDAQNQIIRMQSEIIDELARTLMQHIDADDMPCLKEIRQAARLTEDLKRWTQS